MNDFKRYILNFLKRRTLSHNQKNTHFILKINDLVGFKVTNVELYREAFSLKKSNTNHSQKNYERLEFLGDAVLGSIISYYLFENYPHKNEGFLTQMKSKIVNRKNLNRIGEKLHLTTFIQNHRTYMLSENISGNLFEALLGAIYLDTNYKTCQRVVEKWLLNPEELSRLETKIISYKSLLLEWSQKKKVRIQYDVHEEPLPNNTFCFKCSVVLEDRKIISATESSKKKAEEKAAQRAFYSLNKREQIIEK